MILIRSIAPSKRKRHIRNPPVLAVVVVDDAEELWLTAAESVRMAAFAAVTDVRRPAACTRMERALTIGIAAATGAVCRISSGLSMTMSMSRLRLSALRRPSSADVLTVVESAETRACSAWREALHPQARNAHSVIERNIGDAVRRNSSGIFIFGPGVKTWTGFCGKLAVAVDGSCGKALFQFSD